MRIAVNTRLLLPQRLEGIGRFKHEVLQRLVERYPEHEFLFLFDRPYDDCFVYGPNVEAVVVPPPSRHPVLWYLWFEWALPLVLSRHRADVFLSMDGYCSLRTKVPTVMVTHDIAHVHYPEQVPAAARWYYNHFVPRYLARANSVVTVSDFCRSDISEHYAIPLDKIRVAGNAAHPRFVPLDAKGQARVRQQYAEGQQYFFYLGALHPRKNIARLLQAFSAFKAQTSSPVKLLIGGRFAWQSGGIKTAYDQSEYREDIHFLGYVQDEDLVRIIASAMALTYVSLFEGFGVPIIEAMQAGVPVMTSSVSSMPEVAGDAGLLVDPTNTVEIAAGMQRLYEDEGLRQQLSKRGFNRAGIYTWEQTTDVIEQALNGVARDAD